MQNNFESFDNLEVSAQQSSIIQQRAGLGAVYMYKQFIEYQQSNANTAVLFDKMVENMALTVEYLKQSFTVRGIPSENIYYEYDKVRHIAIMKILWHSITFYSNMKDTPKALPKEKDVPMFSGRIIAIKGTIPELIHGYSDEIEQKLLDMEVSSLFVPAQRILIPPRVTYSQNILLPVTLRHMRTTRSILH